MNALKYAWKASCLTLVVMALLVLVGSAMADMTPGFLEATLHPGECVEETKEVTVDEIPPKVDVIFAFDLTGSMGGIISTAKTKAGQIMSQLNAATGVSIQYGVMSYMDYPHSYTSCGYSAMYGDASSGDYAYRLDQSSTGDTTAVTTAINGLVLGYGADGPHDYTRIFYESYADPAVGWRTGAKRILVNFGDNVPHDCDLNEGVVSGTWTTGGDPGRDEVMGTADDLDLQTVLSDMSANGVTLLESHTSSSANALWAYWTGLTGGNVFITNSTNLVTNVVNAVLGAVTTPQVCGLHLEATGPYNAWLISDPSSYGCFAPPNTKTFEVSICVPDDATEGTHIFTVNAFDEADVSYGEQIVSIEVIVTIPVDIDIKPGSYPNSINKNGKGVIPVAILGSADFDVTQIDPTTLSFDGAQVSVKGNGAPQCSVEDVRGDFTTPEGAPDGYADLVCQFIDDASDWPVGPGTATVTGNLFDGTPIEGTDTINVVQ